MDLRSFVVGVNVSEALIAIGSDAAAKVWGKAQFGKKGDIYWFERPGKDVDKTDEHLSIHRSGEVRNTLDNLDMPEPRIDSFDGATQIVKLLSGEERFSKDYFYSGLSTFKGLKKKQLLLECLDPLVVGSTLRYWLELVNSCDDSDIQELVTTHIDPNSERSHAFVFKHDGRSLVVSMQFFSGKSPVILKKLEEADSSRHEHKKLFVFDSISIG